METITLRPSVEEWRKDLDLAMAPLQIYREPFYKQGLFEQLKKLASLLCEYHGIHAEVNYSDPEVFGQDVSPNVVGECPFGSDGRYHRARVTIPEGTQWTQAYGVDVRAIPAGSV